MESDSKRSGEGPAEKLPLEVIEDILSRVRIALDVIRASVTCKMWREAYCKHLHTLSFGVSSFKFPKGQDSVPDIEMLVTKAILQTRGLRKLSIQMGNSYHFSASSVCSWLMCVRETLSELCCEVRTSTRVNVLDIFEGRKLEILSMSDCKMGRVKQNIQRFQCLTSLSLRNVSISVEHLNRFLNALPKLESLKLEASFLEPSWVSFYDEFVETEKVVKVHCPTLKTLFLENMKLSQFILESSIIEYLQVECCSFKLFEVYGSKTLRDLKISHSRARLLEIDGTDNLESFEFVKSATNSNLFQMMMQSAKMKKIRLWGLEKYKRNHDGESEQRVLDLERMAICSPQLSHLAILCDEGVDGLVYRFGGSASFEKVMVLEIGWHGFDGFGAWAERLLKCCPNVKKVTVHWAIEEKNSNKLKSFCAVLIDD
ncbi:unnamed protein product [Cuscuta campestris]|uniref:F-box domain-containing protein n=1 Tax=Cuscuta campestris TaxID=132261 RepID=A0A484LDT1_9ASTE|nr:unnamed protein product [Cuscuta campestris]